MRGHVNETRAELALFSSVGYEAARRAALSTEGIVRADTLHGRISQAQGEFSSISKTQQAAGPLKPTLPLSLTHPVQQAQQKASSEEAAAAAAAK